MCRRLKRNVNSPSQTRHSLVGLSVGARNEKSFEGILVHSGIFDLFGPSQATSSLGMVLTHNNS